MENILKVIKCVNCQFTLNSPVILPCGHSICKKHETENNETSIRCGKCGKDHSISPDCFPDNEPLTMLIATGIEELDFGDVYNKAKLYCEELGVLHQKIENLLKDPEYFIYQQVSDLKNKVQIKSEEMKLKIDEETSRLLEKLSKMEADCKEYSTSSKYINNENAKYLGITIKEEQSKLKSCTDSLNKMRIDENKWNEIIKECLQSQDLLCEPFEYLKTDLFLNMFGLMQSNVEYFCKIDLEKMIKYKYANIESDIINLFQRESFGELLEVSIEQKWNLLYRATRDGFKAADFHAKCDGKSKTLVIIKVASGNIFGGYADCTWDQSERAKSGKNDYIFSFRNKSNKKLIIRNVYSGIYNSIYCSAKFGPVFGYSVISSGCDSYDFAIADCSNSNESSVSNLGIVFSHPYYLKSSNDAKSFLAGSHHFKVVEIEVFESI